MNGLVRCLGIPRGAESLTRLATWKLLGARALVKQRGRPNSAVL
jgi:hypothetical protein